MLFLIFVSVYKVCTYIFVCLYVENNVQYKLTAKHLKRIYIDLETYKSPQESFILYLYTYIFIAQLRT